jgi:hypothetical protein
MFEVGAECAKDNDDVKRSGNCHQREAVGTADGITEDDEV